MRKQLTQDEIQAKYYEIKQQEREQKEAERKAELLKIGREARQVNKTVGLKPLKGTARQKAWGEKIRASFLDNIMSDTAFDLIANSAMTAHAKFWIDTKDLDRAKLEEAMVNLITATAKANEIGAGNDGYEEQLEIRQTALDFIN